MTHELTRELTPWLLRLALCTTLALLLVLAIRAPLRRACGAAAAYQAWLLVPLVALVASLPTRFLLTPTPTLHVTAALRTVRGAALRMVPAPSPQVDIVLLVWMAGALALAGWFVHTHRAFLRSADAGAAGPASVGLLRPNIIVPQDFAQRYTPAEQMLVIAHEQVHIARRDALANLLQATFQCVFWFNPLVHLAALRFRQDQELSCDARVMAQYPGQRRPYAEALLKSHTTMPLQGGLHCHWQTRQPIKERFMQLQSTPPRLSRRIAGRALVVMLAAGALAGTLAARAEPAAPTYGVAMTIDAGDLHAAPRVLARGGEQFAVATGAWRIEMTVRAARDADTVWVVSKVYKDGAVVSAPTLLARLDGPAAIKLGSNVDPFALSMVVTRQP